MRRFLLLLLTASFLGAAASEWPTRITLNIGETVTASRNGGAAHQFKLLSIAHQTMPFRRNAADGTIFYTATAQMEIDGAAVTLTARPYQFPRVAGGLRLLIENTKIWSESGTFAATAHPKDLSLTFTNAGESWGPSDTRFPVGQFRWHASSYHNTWMGLVPQDALIYYHRGEDLGALPNLLPLLATRAGTITSIPTVLLRDTDGAVFRFNHMFEDHIYVTPGQNVAAGATMAHTGGDKEPHLHVNFSAPDGTARNTFPLMAESYLRDYPDSGIAMAGGYQFMAQGQTIVLDATRSLARPGRSITGYRWILHDGTQVNGPTANLTIAAEGFYFQELRVTYDDGSEQRDFTPVRVFGPGGGQIGTPSLVFQYPLRGNRPGTPVTIQLAPMLISVSSSTINFGDGTATEALGGSRAHTYAAPGLYTVTITANSNQVLKTSVLVEGTEPTNVSPSVNAGPDRAITLPATASLDGTVSDDGRPTGSTLTQTWTTVSGPGTVTFANANAVDTTAAFSAAGTYVLRLTASDGSLSANDTMTVVVSTAAASGTYGNGSSPWTVPASAALRVEAEYFDLGGEGIAFHDTDAKQGGWNVRSGGTANEVDTLAIPSGGVKVGYIAAGEWLRYTVAVPTNGQYTIALRAASGLASGAPNAIGLRWKGAAVGSAVSVPATGSYDTFTTITIPGISLQAGTASFEIAALTGSFDLDWFEITATVGASTGTYGNNGSPWTVPASAALRVEAEYFDLGGEGNGFHDSDAKQGGWNVRSTNSANEVDTLAIASGGVKVGYVTAGEWLRYTVAVPTSGQYAVALRVASGVAGGAPNAIGLRWKGTAVGSTVSVPATGDYDAFTTITIPGITLQAGTASFEITALTSGFDLDWFEITASTSTSGTYGNGGSPWNVPVAGALRVEAEHFDLGGEGTGFHDSDAKQGGWNVRSASTANEVDTLAIASGGVKVGYIVAGEWLRYTVAVPTNGLYTVALRAASGVTGGAPNAIGLRWKGSTVGSAVSVPATGSYDTFTTITIPGISLQAGTASFEITALTGGFDLDWFEITATTAGTETYGNGGVPWTIPASGAVRIQAEHFNLGGEGVAYHDSDAKQGDWNVRSTGTANEVDTHAFPGGGVKVGYTAAGEWLRYTVAASFAGSHQLSLRVSSGVAGGAPGALVILWNGSQLGSPVSIPATGGWDAFTEIDLPAIVLPSGAGILELRCAGSGFDLDWLELIRDPAANG